MIINYIDYIKYKGKNNGIEYSLPLPISMPEFMKKCEERFKCPFSFCGHSSDWEIIDDKLYLVSSEGTIKVNDKEKYRKERLRLRELLRRGEITPAQNGHMLKALSRETRYETEVDLEFMLGRPAPIFADWITTEIHNPQQSGRFSEIDGFDTSDPLIIKVHKGMVILMEKPAKAKVKNFPDNSKKYTDLLSEEFLTRYTGQERQAVRNAVFKTRPFRFGKY